MTGAVRVTGYGLRVAVRGSGCEVRVTECALRVVGYKLPVEVNSSFRVSCLCPPGFRLRFSELRRTRRWAGRCQNSGNLWPIVGGRIRFSNN